MEKCRAYVHEFHFRFFHNGLKIQRTGKIINYQMGLRLRNLLLLFKNVRSQTWADKIQKGPHAHCRKQRSTAISINYPKII